MPDQGIQVRIRELPIRSPTALVDALVEIDRSGRRNSVLESAVETAFSELRDLRWKGGCFTR